MKENYRTLKRKIIFDLLDEFPDAPSNTLAKIARRDNPKFFADSEDARGIIRRYRGKNGVHKRNTMKTQKYYKQ